MAAAIKIFLNEIQKDVQQAICTGINTILEKQTDKIGGIITDNLNKLFEIDDIKKQLETLVTNMITNQFSTIFEGEEIKNIFKEQLKLHLNKIGGDVRASAPAPLEPESAPLESVSAPSAPLESVSAASAWVRRAAGSTTAPTMWPRSPAWQNFWSTPSSRKASARNTWASSP